jgi:exonuclease SbcC
MKVTIDNFQSIEHTEFEVKGLTVITGPNNTGKSACARAVMGAFTNTRGSSFVRQGTKGCRVQIDFNDGKSLVWEKGKNTNRYEVDGFEIDKVGSGVPDEVKQLGVVAVEVDGKEVYPQIARQFEQIFLLDMPPSVLSSALSDVDKIQVLEQATALARNEVKSINNRIKVKAEDLEQERKKATAFDELNLAQNAHNQVQILKQNLSNMEQEIKQLGEEMEKRMRLKNTIHSLAEVERIKLPKTQDISEFNAITELERIKRERSRCFSLDKSISIGLDSLPPLPEVKGFERIDSLERVLNTRKSYLNLSKNLSNLQEIDMDKHSTLEGLIEALTEDLSYAERRRDLASKLQIADKEADKIGDDLDNLKASIGDVCPLCDKACGDTH